MDSSSGIRGRGFGHPAPSSDEPGLPSYVGRYPVIGKLGRGGMGDVFLALDPTLERRIALKVISSRLAVDRMGLVRFEREAKLLASLDHPNVATVFSLEQADDIPFITMEFIPGETLAEWICNEPLPLGQALSICRQVATALEAAHQRGIVHRDLKPANIKIAPRGQVKVLDFGLAKALLITSQAATPPTLDHTPSGVTLGTPGYMSPEQILGHQVDHRADNWAFGCILFECLAGVPAFPGDNYIEKNRAVLHRDPEWNALPGDIPDGIRDLLASCLTKDPTARLGMISHARREIEEQIGRRALISSIPGPQEPAETHNLPVQISTFVGRAREMNEALRMLEESRLLTMTGAGGSGKTRLALEVARKLLPAFSDGVWRVELSPLADAALVPQSLAAVLDLSEQAATPLIATVIKHLRKRQALVILDNCEHLLEACAALTERLLESCPHLRILATSREPLGILGESIYRIPSLSIPAEGVPPSTDEFRSIEAVALFVVRAKGVRPDFALTSDNAEAIGQICRRLDGIPLALELAAARVKVVSVEEIARRLDDRFHLLTGGSKTALPRHQTLRALIDWSYDHLTEPEQLLLRSLSVFVGGWTLDAAENVCSSDSMERWEVLDLLSHLVDKSLVDVDPRTESKSHEVRYRMLEMVREYARDRLFDAAEAIHVRQRHRDHFLSMAEQAESHLTARDQAIWLSRLVAEHDNLRLALEACAGDSDGPELGLRLAGALGRFWLIRGHWSEGRSFCSALLDCSAARRGTPARAKVLNWVGNLTYMQGDYDQAASFYHQSLAIRRRLRDREGIAASLNNLGGVASKQGDYPRARTYHEESLALHRESGNRWAIAGSLNNLGGIASRQGEYAQARRYHEESLAIRRSLGDQRGTATSLTNLGIVAEKEGDYVRARMLYSESLEVQQELGDKAGVALSLANLGNVAAWDGDHSLAHSYHQQSLAIRRDLGDRPGIAESLNNLGIVASKQADYPTALLCFRESLEIQRQLGNRSGIALSLEALGALATARNQAVRAVRLLAAAQAIREDIKEPLSSAERRGLDRDIPVLRENLGDDRFTEEWSNGRAMHFEEAAEYALDHEAPETTDCEARQ